MRLIYLLAGVLFGGTPPDDGVLRVDALLLLPQIPFVEQA
jgi:hypothetical protein